MPFDPAPREVKVGNFQDVADAMLRGCAMSRPCFGIMFDAANGACAIGAYYLGADFRKPCTREHRHAVLTRRSDVGEAYEERYGRRIEDDNDSTDFTREQIAARIAAL